MKGCGNTCMKYTIIFINSVFLILGLALAGIAGYAAFDTNSYIHRFIVGLGIHNIVIGLYIMMGVGLFLALVSFLGCFGAFTENRCLLGTYFGIVLVIFIVELAAVILCFVKFKSVKSKFLAEMNSVKNGTSTSTSLIIQGMNKVQQEMQCCGLSGPGDWKMSKIPNSCYAPVKKTVKPVAVGDQSSDDVNDGAAIKEALEHINNALQNGEGGETPAPSSGERSKGQSLSPSNGQKSNSGPTNIQAKVEGSSKSVSPTQSSTQTTTTTTTTPATIAAATTTTTTTTLATTEATTTTTTKPPETITSKNTERSPATSGMGEKPSPTPSTTTTTAAKAKTTTTTTTKKSGITAAPSVHGPLYNDGCLSRLKPAFYAAGGIGIFVLLLELLVMTMACLMFGELKNGYDNLA